MSDPRKAAVLDDRVIGDFADLGIRFDNLNSSAETFEVWPENVESVELFGMLSTQWRIVSGRSGIIETGLDYAAVNATTLAMFGRKALKRLMSDIMDMESAALEFFAEVSP